MPATLFVVGRDLLEDVNQKRVRDAFDNGHEIASHSFHHDYRLSQKPRAGIDDDLTRAEDYFVSCTVPEPADANLTGLHIDPVLA